MREVAGGGWLGVGEGGLGKGWAAVTGVAGATSPSRPTSEYDRDRATVARHVASLVMSWYSPVSLKLMVVSVAWMVVTMAA
jgi:hypothetical protein